MKQKILFSLVFLFALFSGASAFANCNNISFTTLQAGNTVTFSASVPAGYVINTYNWTFGDGANSTAPNPAHTYANFGWYNACMVISGIDANNGIFQCTYCDSIFIANNAPCNASFIYTTSGLNAAFTNTATGPGVITNYAWNFGDGNQSNLANPSHTYAANGTYNACLTIYGIDSGITYTCTWCDSVTVGANNQPCNASFISTVSGNLAAFTNTATGPGVITAYSWTFGDGGTSLLPNPTHTYANTGWYNVCLSISGIDNNVAYTCTWCDSVYVQIPGGNPCNGVSYTTTQLGNAVTFNAVVPAGYVINTYNWNFGDGGTSNLANPTHTYANFGWYNACMVISGIDANNGIFQCSYCDSIYIANNAPCNASFIYTTSGLNANFTNTATGPGVITNYAWNFGDGNQSNLPNPSHTYAASGTYNACLTIYGIDNGITYTCTWCDSVTVGAANPCNGVYFSFVQAGNNVTFNAVTPAGYVINTYYWTFGDGGNSTVANPTHTYSSNGNYNICMTVSGMANNTPFQCSVCDTISVLASGINDVDANSTLQVYPNPATNYLEITLPSNDHFTLKVYDVAGKLLDEKQIKNSPEKYTFNTEGLTKGLYFIQLISDKKKYQSNFIKQ